MNLENINQLTAQDMAGVNAAILEQLNSSVQLINQLGYYIISGGGKRIRPMIAVLSARALGYEGSAHIAVAALIEFIHTATLLHDDVVDESDMRRGKATANAAFGNAASVLVGDFIYTRAFQMMTRLGSLKVLEVMSEAVNVIAEGEVLQLMNVNDPDITEENYMRVIYSKTARLFEAASQCSGILAGATPEQERALQDYGRYLGTAFQLIDDLLDYSADGETLGKNVGDDLNEGKPTLPLLHAMHHGTPKQKEMIRHAIEQGNGRHLLEPVLETMAACGSLEWTRRRAEDEADKAIAALAPLPDSLYKKALIGLAHIAVQRSH
ncbi:MULTISPECIES: octaprenyl diphosphate synthase [Tenebrionibacter/Tenebrionicola group]|jgi:octaprenyl-diphosphate synthase|uniref:Octaprenyl diphosphate synthase n=2 Tax=Tenebrionibacter/Tenebrionicola group TaxID=2969848 RepID=A0A8K0V563_9ENTR|nr:MULTISPECIES: octaprenyl diphosphate synthase [Tenebrionibacter/Tenebrionicola group]MBK4715325.1 octaprenyl diphosphate synthase [Tenebrionibacter intestinalis]MBV4412977.1 octaprenyl diphosphate synthase [Tenebrionicola larvae]MBV5094544.1 octaprenyl diphosphate synthase [Tenebrionicola larvae]